MKVAAALVAAGALAGALAAQPARAVVFATGTETITTADPTQLGRPMRDGIASTWQTPKTYPGVLPSSVNVTYYYDTSNTTFASNAFQTIYYEIAVKDINNSGLVFASAYQNSYNASNRSTGYLGDEGSSGNDPTTGSRVFQVIVPTAQQLYLVFNTTGGGTSGVGNPLFYTVAAFSDANRSENFLTALPSAVPEPATWAMTMLGVGAIGAGLRRRQRVTKRLAFA